MKTQGTWINQNNPEKEQQSWRTPDIPISNFDAKLQKSKLCSNDTKTVGCQQGCNINDKITVSSTNGAKTTG